MGIYAEVIKCSYAVSDSLVISTYKIRAPVPAPQPSTSSVLKLLDLLCRHCYNYFLKLIANQHLTKILCEPLCPKTPMEDCTDYCQNKCDLQQDHVPLHPLRSLQLCMLARQPSKSHSGPVLKVL